MNDPQLENPIATRANNEAEIRKANQYHLMQVPYSSLHVQNYPRKVYTHKLAYYLEDIIRVIPVVDVWEPMSEEDLKKGKIRGYHITDIASCDGMEHMEEYVNRCSKHWNSVQTLEPHENCSCNSAANEQKLM